MQLNFTRTLLHLWKNKSTKNRYYYIIQLLFVPFRFIFNGTSARTRNYVTHIDKYICIIIRTYVFNIDIPRNAKCRKLLLVACRYVHFSWSYSILKIRHARAIHERELRVFFARNSTGALKKQMWKCVYYVLWNIISRHWKVRVRVGQFFPRSRL